MKNSNWKKLLGYTPSREQKIQILAMVRDEGISLAEACAKIALPPLYLENEQPDPEEYDNPFRPAIRIRRRRDNE